MNCNLKKTISFAAAAVMLSAGSLSAFAEEAVFPESSQEQTVSGEEYESAEPAEPIDDVVIDDSSAEDSSAAESDESYNSYDSYDSAEESIADEQQAQESEPIYIAAVSAPTLSIEKTNKTTIRIAWNTQDCYSYIVERRMNGGKYEMLATVLNKPNKDKLTYTDKSLSYGDTAAYRVRACVVNDGETEYSKYSNVVKFKAKLDTPKLNATRSGLYAATVKWKSVKGADGYRVSIKKDGKWKHYLTTKTSRTLKGLRSHTNYEVRVRAYVTVNGEKMYSDAMKEYVWTDSKLKSGRYYAIYSKRTANSKIKRYMYAGSVIQQKGTPSNGWAEVYIPGTNKTQTGFIRTDNMYYYQNLGLTVINQNSYAGGAVAPLGCEETSLASILKYQYGFNVTKNELINYYMTARSFYWGGYGWAIDVDPNYAFWGSPYHGSEPDGYGYGVYAPAIAQSANVYLRNKKAVNGYDISLNTDYYTGNNHNGVKFDPSKLDLGNTKLAGGLSKEGLIAELEKGHNLIVWFDSGYGPYITTRQVLRKGTKYTNSGSGTYVFEWYGHQHTAVLTGYDDSTGQFIISNVWNNNRYSYTGVTTRMSYSSFMNGYTKMGRQSIVISRKGQ